MRRRTVTATGTAMGELLTGSIRAECLIPLPGGLSRFVTRTMLIWTRVAGVKALVHGAFRHSILPRHALYHIYNSVRLSLVTYVNSASLVPSHHLLLCRLPCAHIPSWVVQTRGRSLQVVLNFASRIFCFPVTFALTLVLGLPRITASATSSTFAQHQFPPG
ncbi:hypothetical protein B0H11DRAFT_1147705 [Mycena galericulata]|nr:hypothetical protein B0H11DRAFT_1147705 [Mycena galericulata]